MKNKIFRVAVAMSLAISMALGNLTNFRDVKKVEAATPEVHVEYTTHIQNIGWAGYAEIKDSSLNKAVRANYNVTSVARKDGEIGGTTGVSRRLEGITVQLTDANGKKIDSSYGGVEYRTHVQNIGWVGWATLKSKDLDKSKSESYNPKWTFRRDGETSGTEAASRRLEAITIRLYGKVAEDYDIYYRVHAQTFGWLDWAKNGEASGTSGLSRRLEGIQIVLVKKGEGAPSENYKGASLNIKSKSFAWFNSVNMDAPNGPELTHNLAKRSMDSVTYNKVPRIVYNSCSRVFPDEVKINNQRAGLYDGSGFNYVWQGGVLEGSSAGTFGKAAPISSVQMMLLNISGGVTYSTYKNGTWYEAKDGEATDNKAEKIEALRIRLTGDAASQYDIYYRVHIQNEGWLAWAKNGETSGTIGKDLRLEGYQVVLREKGSEKPSDTFEGVTSAKSYPVLCESHNYEDGVCSECGTECTHQYDESTFVVTTDKISKICTVCGMKAETPNTCEHTYSAIDTGEFEILLACTKCGATTREPNTCNHHWVQMKDESRMVSGYVCSARDYDFELAWNFYNTHPDAFEWVQTYLDDLEWDGPIGKNEIIAAHRQGYDRPAEENTDACDGGWGYRDHAYFYYECDICHARPN